MLYLESETVLDTGLSSVGITLAVLWTTRHSARLRLRWLIGMECVYIV